VRRVALAALFFASATAAAAPARILLQDVTLIDGTGAAPRAHCDLLIEGARIAAIGATGTMRVRDSEVVPLPGRFVVPGFIDLHAHVMLHPWDERGQIVPRADRAASLELLRDLLAWGVTTARDPGAETEAAVALRGAIADGRVLGPTLFTAGRMLNASDFAIEPFAPVHDAEAVRREIRRQAALGVDAIKVYSAMPPALVKVAIAEAHAHRLPVLGHLQATTWTEAAALGIDGVEHAAPWSAAYLPPGARAAYDGSLFGRVYWLEELDVDGPEVRAMIDALLAHDVTVDPTLVAMRTKLFGDEAAHAPDVARAPAAYRAGWPAGSFTASWTAAQYRRAHAVWPKLAALTARLWRRGVRIVVGTDTPTPWIAPGASVHEEMALLHDAGLPPLEVLRAATANAARALGHARDFGTLAPGMRADLVVLSKDPVADIHNTRAIERVYRGGVLVPR
jgi:imidazolonepropionase-like amidohydrolase